MQITVRAFYSNLLKKIVDKPVFHINPIIDIKYSLEMCEKFIKSLHTLKFKNIIIMAYIRLDYIILHITESLTTHHQFNTVNKIGKIIQQVLSRLYELNYCRTIRKLIKHIKLSS